MVPVKLNFSEVCVQVDLLGSVAVTELGWKHEVSMEELRELRPSPGACSCALSLRK